MSFDVSLWSMTARTVSTKQIGAWMAADPRVDLDVEPAERMFEATVPWRGTPWASFEVEDVSDLEDGDREVWPGYHWSGVRFGVSYSTPTEAVPALFAPVFDLAAAFDLVVLDEQADTPVMASLESIAQSWTTVRAIVAAQIEGLADN